MIDNAPAPTPLLPLADRALTWTDADLRRRILIERRIYRTACSPRLKDRALRNHSTLMTLLRERLAARAEMP